MINLIRNAIESRPEGACIVLRNSSGPETVCVEVQDNGFGVKPDVIKLSVLKTRYYLNLLDFLALSSWSNHE